MNKEKTQPEKQITRNGNGIRNSKRINLDSTQEATEKRKRSSNFHIKEIEDLLNFIDSQKTVIECKRTDQLTNARKDKTWKAISHLFNQKNPTKRSDKQLRSKWETLKKIARKEYMSGKLSTVSNNVLKIMLSSNELDIKFNESDISLRLKEEPYFAVDQISNEDDQQGNHVAGLAAQPTNPDDTTRQIIRTGSPQTEMINTTTLLEESDIPEYSFSEQNQNPIVSPRTIQNSSRMKSDQKKTKSTQYNIKDTETVRKRRKFYNKKINQIFLVEENKRKREKHQLKMEILKLELSLKKKQLENIRNGCISF